MKNEDKHISKNKNVELQVRKNNSEKDIPELPTEVIEKVFLELANIDATFSFRRINHLSRKFHYGFTRNSILKNVVPCSIDNASGKGQIALLDWWLNHSGINLLDLTFTTRAIGFACEHNEIESLNWFYNASRTHKLPFKYDAYAIEKACANGHISVLRWFAQHDLEMKWIKCPYQIAQEKGYVEICEWWIKSGQLTIWCHKTKTFC